MSELLSQLPWAVNLIEFGVMAFIVIRIVHVLDAALARAQSPGVAPPTPAPLPAPTPGKVVAPTPSPAPSPVIDQGLIAFVKKQEGFVAKAQWDYKQYTYGYGTRAPSADATISEADAAAALIAEINSANASVKKFAPNLPKGIEQALTDLTFNAGAGWETAGLGEHIKAGDWASAKASLLQYNHAGGQVLDALTKRREAEASWFDNPL